MELSRRDVFFMVKDSLKNEQKFVIGVLKDAIFKKTEHVIQVDEDEKSLGLLFANFRSRWKAANRGQEKFLKNNEEWLNGTVCFSTLSDTECTTSTSEKIVKNDEKGTSGRPSKSFASSSDRSKRRKTEEIRSTLSTEELTYAAQMSLRTSGQVDAAQVLKDVTLTSPTRASKYIAAVRSKNETPLTPDEALSLMIEKGESKRSYQLSRNAARARKCKLYPSYHEVEKAKNRCYPSVVYMNITESCAQIKLQALLDHTTYRIIQLQADVIDTLNSEILQKLVLHCKWGCDGSSGQSVYKQKFDEAGKSDESIFYTSLVPLQLIYNNHETDEGTIVWKNPRPSSPRFCRPIRLQFVHEDVQSTLKEVTDIEQQIAGLAPYTTEQNEKSISVTYCMSFTMIDGKVCNAVTGTTSAQRCFLCKATSKDFNNIDKIIKMDITTDNLRFGISTLHAWIRFFECCLHLSYKLTTQKWQAREEEVKKIVKVRKEDIQTQFKTTLGLIVDRPKPGYGSSNDGNTARRFFENANISAEITGVDENLIHRFHVILQAISSGYDIDEEKFKDYCVNTARLFVALYPWYYMPTSVHKVLMHGAEIVKYALLPIGQLSEEAQESRNKDIKNYRLHHSRKCSRESNMRDIFYRLLVSSDPFLSSIRKLPQRPAKSLHKEAIEMLKQPEVTRQEIRNDSDLDTSGSTSESESNDSNIEDDIQDFCY